VMDEPHPRPCLNGSRRRGHIEKEFPLEDVSRRSARSPVFGHSEIAHENDPFESRIPEKPLRISAELTSERLRDARHFVLGGIRGRTPAPLIFESPGTAGP